MEYFLIEQAEGDVEGPGPYIVRRPADLDDMGSIDRLTALIVSAIIDLVEEAPWLSGDRPYSGISTTPSGFGARIYVKPKVYDLASRKFGTIVDYYVNRFREEQEEVASV